MDKTVKNVLAAVGAVALVKAAPVLATGAAIGAVAANPDKAKKAVEGFVGQVEDIVDRVAAKAEKYAAEAADFMADPNRTPWDEEEECECCNGGPCTCNGECQCDEARDPATLSEEDETSEDWEEEVPVEEEPEPVATPAEDNEEEAHRAKRDRFIDTLMAALGDISSFE